MDEKYDVNRKKNKTDRPAPYKDPFKAHMMNMQNKLIYGWRVKNRQILWSRKEKKLIFWFIPPTHIS